MSVSPAILARLKAAVGPGGTLESDVDTDPFVRDWRGRYRGATLLVLRPASTAEVAAIVAICSETGTALVPQGGNTSMVAGGIPRAGGEDIVLSLSRMKRIRELDPANHTMTVEAGCVLADVQAAAREAGRLFPLSLAAEGSCQIGGNLSTNAGGTAVLRYGNARDLVLGLEVVLPDGSVWDGLRALRKDNSGFDLKQIFLGAEGSLGIITAAVVKLFPLPAEVVTAMVTLPAPADATHLLNRLREASGDAVLTFEYINRNCLDLVLQHIPGTVDPLGSRFAHYALVELAAGSGGAHLAPVLEDVLAEGLEGGWVCDAALAASEAQAAKLWKLRESIPEAARADGGCIAHDVSVPVSRVAELLVRGTALCEGAIEGVRVIAFGHLGDGNIHFNVVRPRGEAAAPFLERRADLTPRVDDLVSALDGSFSAEHGIGQLKREQLRRYRSPTELAVMEKIKAALDPGGIMNPGKVL